MYNFHKAIELRVLVDPNKRKLKIKRQLFPLLATTSLFICYDRLTLNIQLPFQIGNEPCFRCKAHDGEVHYRWQTPTRHSLDLCMKCQVSHFFSLVDVFNLCIKEPQIRTVQWPDSPAVLHDFRSWFWPRST